ncbi:c-type cytochrome [Litchfieldella xinjiangensis]|uniref:c-type cytochrome n=1 Tax=Litchfieldella xinjiangensis TaxID=1166948 RepID=UPI000A3E9FB7|nr:c-type cytochrome [Halomonas xinjiangensis]
MKFKLIMGCLATLGLSLAGTAHAQDNAEHEAIAERLKPVGQLCMQGQDCGSASAPAASSGGGGGEISGSGIYGNVCAACHDSGAAGAPVRGEEDQWTARIDQGIETLYEHAITGIGAMPPKGGNPSLSDDEVKAAVNHLVDPLMEDLPEIGGGGEGEATQAEAESNGDAAEAETAAAASGESDAEATTQQGDAAQEGEAASEGASNLDGESLYAGAGCAACHSSGAAGAPIVGNADDWAPRIEKGKEELYSSAINGIGAMPPKGGNTSLSDDEVKAIVDHMVEQSQ